jgi:isoleucyl-tRNA synthetase
MGHALNKTLKDMVNKVSMLDGYRVEYKPGWDCHGLPIEMHALSELRKKHKGPQQPLDPVEIRKIARASAVATVAMQSETFRSWGIVGDWDTPYKTLDTDYIVRQLRVFQRLVEKGRLTFENHKG